MHHTSHSTSSSRIPSVHYERDYLLLKPAERFWQNISAEIARYSPLHLLNPNCILTSYPEKPHRYQSHNIVTSSPNTKMSLTKSLHASIKKMKKALTGKHEKPERLSLSRFFIKDPNTVKYPTADAVSRRFFYLTEGKAIPALMWLDKNGNIYWECWRQ
jgi:hypothetical protein